MNVLVFVLGSSAASVVFTALAWNNGSPLAVFLALSVVLGGVVAAVMLRGAPAGPARRSAYLNELELDQAALHEMRMAHPGMARSS